MDPVLRRPVAMCSKHTLEQRLLAPATEDWPSHQSNMVLNDDSESDEEQANDLKEESKIPSSNQLKE